MGNIKNLSLFMKGKHKYIVSSYFIIILKQFITNIYHFKEKDYLACIRFSRYLYDIPFYVCIYLFGLIPVINYIVKKEVITKYSDKLQFALLCLRFSFIYSLCFSLVFNLGSFIMCFIAIGTNCFNGYIIIYHIVSVVINSLGWTLFGLIAFVFKSNINNPLIVSVNSSAHRKNLSSVVKYLHY